jgi:hypothetical protein
VFGDAAEEPRRFDVTAGGRHDAGMQRLEEDRLRGVPSDPHPSPTTVRNRRSAYERDVRLQVFAYHAR